MLRIGVDIGGTFTDFVVFDPQKKSLSAFKLPSTPHEPEKALLEGLQRLSVKKGLEIVHGSTVATNALLERKGAPTALVTTRGFRDVLQIGRQNRPSLYDFFADPPAPLVPEELRLEVDERVNHNGEVVTPLTEESLNAVIETLNRLKPESVAVCLLFSFLHPEHEQAIAAALEQAGFFVSVSSEILPEFREYERTSTTVVNAYISPVMGRYLSRLENDLGETKLRIMQSNGGSMSPAEARRSAVRCILSGPAGGVVGSQAVARQAGFGRIVTFDMGGTSTDVSVVDGEIRATTESDVGGYPIRIPILDIHTVGAGGGSIAKVDMGGALRVGPGSAGADPGPACYGRGNLPTVTDANLVLGRIDPARFLGGAMSLNLRRAKDSITPLADELKLSIEQVALGIIEVANAHMERALRVILVERGHDPQDFILVSYGGAGGLHAADLARRLSIAKILVPPQAATLSALGMLMADVVRDYSQTVMLSGDVPMNDLQSKLNPLIERARRDLLGQGIAPENTDLRPSLDMRYVGQSYELNVPFSEGFAEAFHRRHFQEYGYADKTAPVEIVNVRVRAVGHVPKPELPSFRKEGRSPRSALIDKRSVFLGESAEQIPFYDGEKLMPGNSFAGPAIVVRPDTTILIGPNEKVVVDEFTNLLISFPAS